MRIVFYKNVSRFRKLNKQATKQLNRERLITWRKQQSITKIDRPTKLARARSLGYKPKQGIVLVRVRINRGGRRIIPPTKGRRSKRSGVSRITPNQPRQVIAENRAARRYKNLTVLNSYLAVQDGKSLYYEVILVDAHHPVIRSDKNLNFLSPAVGENESNRARHRGRSFRGLTSSAKRSRGLRNKGKGSEKSR